MKNQEVSVGFFPWGQWKSVKKIICDIWQKDTGAVLQRFTLNVHDMWPRMSFKLWHLCPEIPPGLIMIGVIVASRKVGINPDNVATPIAASLGDLITLSLLAGISTGLYKELGNMSLTFKQAFSSVFTWYVLMKWNVAEEHVKHIKSFRQMCDKNVDLFRCWTNEGFILYYIL